MSVPFKIVQGRNLNYVQHFRSCHNNKIRTKTNITNLAEKIKDNLNSITHIEGHINVSTPSIGITLFSDSSVSVKDIIKQADTAMYVAKKQGKNSIEFFD